MKGPYQIIKERIEDEWGVMFKFKLIRTTDDWLVTSTIAQNSPIPPQWLRDRQAELNTRAMLDK